MNDSISRNAATSAAIKMFNAWYGHSWLRTNEIRAMFEQLPSSGVQHWIPCSERMPETSDAVLTTYIVNGNTKKRYVDIARWWADNSDEDGCWTSIYDEYRVLGTRIERIAWMPLPEPYKDGERNDRT